MPMTQKVHDEVVEIVADVAELEPHEVEVESTLEEMGIDSLDGLRIVAAVEKRFKVVIDEAEIGKIRTMRDILEMVDRHAPDA